MTTNAIIPLNLMIAVIYWTVANVGGRRRRLHLAEGVGFEPTIRFPVYTLSKRAPSATRPSLQRKTVAHYSDGAPRYNPQSSACTACSRRRDAALAARVRQAL